MPSTPAQVALAWLLAQGPHVVPVPGTKTPEYLFDNAGTAGLRLSAADLAVLHRLMGDAAGDPGVRIYR